MGQRSQIYIHYNVRGYNGEVYEGFIARYFQWNYAERMISRARSVIETLWDEYLEYKSCFEDEKERIKLERIADVNFDMKDMQVSTDIFKECRFFNDFSTRKIFGQGNNNGQLLIEVTDNEIKYCFIDYWTEATPMTAEDYIIKEWDTEDWKQPDEYRDEETIAYTERNIDYINRNARLMTPKEVNEFIYRDYGKIINKGEDSNDKL